MSTPLEMKMAIHYSCINEPYALRQPEHRYSPMVIGIQQCWLECGYLRVADAEEKAKGHDFKGTEALRMWVDALCRVPQPIQKWIIPDEPRSPTAPQGARAYP